MKHVSNVSNCQGLGRSALVAVRWRNLTSVWLWCLQSLARRLLVWKENAKNKMNKIELQYIE